MFLSVIVPVYNTKPEFIQECLDSINLLHGLCNYEVIIVNDGSTNTDTCQLFDEIKEGGIHNIVKIQQNNKGLSGARNTGIKHAKGTYILPLDSDDKLHHEIKYFIDHLINNPNTDILYGNLLTFGDERQFYELRVFSASQLILFGNILLACSFFKKTYWDKVGGYDETFRTCEDWDFWCRCAMQGANFQYIPYHNFEYRKIYDGKSLLQQTHHLIPEHHQRILDKLSPCLNHDDIFNDINLLLLKQIKAKPKKAFYLLIFAYFPKLFEWLYKKKIIRYKDNFISF